MIFYFYLLTFLTQWNLHFTFLGFMFTNTLNHGIIMYSSTKRTASHQEMMGDTKLQKMPP